MGVEVELVSAGDGCTFPKEGQQAGVHYICELPDGKVIDNSRERNVIFKFRIGKGEVIKGWDEGIKKMSLGQRAKLRCSSDYAYGKIGVPGVVPPNSELILDIELVQLE